MSALVGVLAGAGALLAGGPGGGRLGVGGGWLGPGRGRLRAGSAEPHRQEARLGPAADVRRGRRSTRTRFGGWRARRPGGSDPAAEGEGRLAAALVEVAAVLRTGVAPAEAWRSVLRSDVAGRIPTVDQLAAVCPAGGGPLAAVVAAATVADELGAPLATVLEQVAAAITARAEVVADVEAALAGPRSSARVLALLPVFGVVLGTVLGADPAGALLGGGVGTASGVLGVAMLLVGRWWTRALLRRAGRAGGDP